MQKAQRILVCESDPLLAELLRARLGSAGYAIDVAQDGLDALERVKQHLPDALIVGDFLPWVDGFELVRRLREDDPRETARDVPIMMLSRKIGDEDVLRALRIGVSEYVVKPFSVPELLARLDKIIRQNQIHKWAKSLQRKVRTPVSIPAHLWLGDGREIDCLVRDVSEDGFMAQVATRLEPGSWSGLSLPAHGVLRAQVRWCRSQQLGGLFERRLHLHQDNFLEAA
jgi:DNA-binding response OmpR family regulator